MSDIIGIYGIADRYTHTYPAYVHDHNITYMTDGKVHSYLHLERYSRRKYDNSFPDHIEDILDSGLIPYHEDTSWVFVNSFAGSSFLSRNGRLRFEVAPQRELTPDLVKGKGWWQHQPWEGRELNAWLLSHELAHVSSCLPFYGPFKENSLLIHFDGGASLSNFSAFVYRDGQLRVHEFHWELSDLSKIFNDNPLTFALMHAGPGEHTSVPGKLMGYAGLGTYRQELADWLLKNEYFRGEWHELRSFFRKARKDFGWKGSIEDQHDPFLQDIAAAFQGLFEQGWLEKVRQLQQKVEADYLYLAGGCALNIVANTKLVDSGWFQDIFIPPCCNDSGLSLGAAAFCAWQQGEDIAIHSPYLNTFGIDIQYTYNNDVICQVGDLIAEGGVVGIANGAAEAGPRALGNRSLIARADDPEITHRVSCICKQREWFRPVAPVMLEHLACAVTGKASLSHLSKYMLLDCTVLPAHAGDLRGVVHAGKSARIQTISARSENPFLFDLLNYMYDTHNIAALINTSFNAKGEPIVHTPQDAYDSALRMGIDAVVMNGQLLNLKNI